MWPISFVALWLYGHIEKPVPIALRTLHGHATVPGLVS